MNSILLQQPARVLFGIGAVNSAPDIFAEAGWRRLFVVASGHIVQQRQEVLDSWQAAGCEIEVCVEVDREPEIALFEKVLARAGAFAPDAVVGLGGGSVLDVAKLVAALMGRPGEVGDYFGIGLLPPRRTGLVCVPTTAGTGSEVSPNAILLDEAARLKKGVVSRHLMPDVAILDPAETTTMPPAVTAATGLDALVHNLEAFTNKFAHPLIDDVALAGIGFIAGSLAAAVRDGSDLEARTAVMRGAYHGGLCLAPVNTAAVHALAYPLGGEFRVPHGVANSLLLPHVTRFNCSASPARHAAVARVLGVEDQGDDLATAKAGIARLERLSLECGIPQRLRDVGVPEDALERMATEAMKVTRLLRNNPREVTAADALAIYREAY